MDNKTKAKIILNFARPYILVVSIIFIIQSVVLFFTLNALENNALSTINNMIDTNIKIIDRSMEEVQNTAKSIAKNSVVKEYFNKTTNTFGVDELQELHSSLMSYYTENENILDICLQNNVANTVVNSTTLYRNTMNFYKSKIKSAKLSGRELMQNSLAKRGFDLGGGGVYEGAAEAFPYSLKFPLQTRDLGSINIYISHDRLFMFLNELARTHSGSYRITTDDGVAYTWADGVMTSAIAAELPKDDFIISAVNDDEYKFSYNSSLADWNINISLDKGSALGDIFLFRNISLIFNFVALILGLFVCFHIAINKSKDYSKIADALNLTDKSRFAIKKNEFIEIYSAISDMQEENKKYLYGSGQNVLRQLVEGDFEDKSDIISQLRKHNITIADRSNAVMVISYENKRDTEFFVANFNTFMVQEISRIIPDAYIYFVGKNRMAVIFPADSDGEDYHDRIKYLVVQLKCEIFSKYNIPASFAADEAAADISDIKLCYAHAAEVVDYCTVTDCKNPNMIFYHELKGNTDKYYYPSKLENLLFEHISACNYEGAKAALQTIRAENFELRSLPLNDIRSLLKELEFSLQKYCDAAGLDVNFFRSADSVNSFFAYAENVLYLLCDKRESSRDKNRELCHEIIRYLNENYADYNLSLAHLSEHFGINASTLSQIFKKNMSYTWSSYLENIRIEHSIELMKEGRMSIKDIAIKVGFSSDTSFRRCFKKVKGVNPKNYIIVD